MKTTDFTLLLSCKKGKTNDSFSFKCWKERRNKNKSERILPMNLSVSRIAFPSPYRSRCFTPLPLVSLLNLFALRVSGLRPSPFSFLVERLHLFALRVSGLRPSPFGRALSPLSLPVELFHPSPYRSSSFTPAHSLPRFPPVKHILDPLLVLKVKTTDSFFYSSYSLVRSPSYSIIR